MVTAQQKYARDLSRRYRHERLIARAITKTVREAKTPPPGMPTDWTTRTKAGELVLRGGPTFPREWL